MLLSELLHSSTPELHKKILDFFCVIQKNIVSLPSDSHVYLEIRRQMFYYRNLYLLCFSILLFLVGCKETVQESTKQRSAYFWSTTFELDSTQLDFIRSHEVSRLYLRYFDVVVDDADRLMPNASVRFVSAQPEGVEIVPTVFIVNDCLMKDVSRLDSLLLRRILQMSETHDVMGVREIQIDCDWTGRTRTAYFDMLSRLRTAAHEKGITLSATIRLHQLSQSPPPVDKGVLMMYNTGDVRDLSHNPILDMEAAGPYLKHLRQYNLPLSTAYPIFSWDLLFRGSRFVGILHSDDEWPILPGDTIVHRDVDIETVLTAKDAVSAHQPSANNEIILFDISKNNMSNINNKRYEEIYSH